MVRRRNNQDYDSNSMQLQLSHPDILMHQSWNVREETAATIAGKFYRLTSHLQCLCIPFPWRLLGIQWYRLRVGGADRHTEAQPTDALSPASPSCLFLLRPR
jgi:hypothetical protein